LKTGNKLNHSGGIFVIKLKIENVSKIHTALVKHLMLDYYLKIWKYILSITGRHTRKYILVSSIIILVPHV